MHFASYYRSRVIREWVEINPTDSLLDVGCDDCEITTKYPAAQRVGIDLIPRGPGLDHIRLIRGAAQRLPLPNNGFDTVVAFDVIEHIESDRDVLVEAIRILKPNGILWLSTTCADFRLVPAVLTTHAARSWGHVRNGYRVDELRAKLPATVTADFMLWNEPFFRASYLLLRLVSAISPSIACRLAGSCYEIDKHFRDGDQGHLFARIHKLSSA
jgi:SAM-dependent methyltransferase